MMLYLHCVADAMQILRIRRGLISINANVVVISREDWAPHSGCLNASQQLSAINKHRSPHLADLSSGISLASGHTHLGTEHWYCQRPKFKTVVLDLESGNDRV